MDINAGNLTILDRAFSAAFREGFGEAAKDHDVMTLTVPSMTLEQQYGWLGQFPGLREWVGERVVRDIASHGYRLVNRLYESTVDLPRTTIEDDQYGVFGSVFRAAGEAAAAHPCELAYGALIRGFSQECYDGQYFFDSDHAGPDGGNVSNRGATVPVQSSIDDGTQVPWFLVCGNRHIKPILYQTRIPYMVQAMTQAHDEQVFSRDIYRWGVRGRGAAGYGLWQLAYGSVDALDANAFRTARVRIMEALGDVGRTMGYRPTHLIVPPELEYAALQILNADRLANGASNVWRGKAELIVSPWLAR